MRRFRQALLQRFLLAVALSLCASGILPRQAVALARHHQERTLVVVLDPGHGGSDTGAADATQTLVEKNLNLQVAKEAQADLQAMGYKVYLTRTRDQAVNTPPRDRNHDGKIDRIDEFTARTTFANRHHADVLVSIHFDGSADTSIHGTHGYYCPARPFWRSSERLATLLTSSISATFTRAGYQSPNNGVQTDVADVIPQARPDYPWFLILGPSLKRFVIASTMPGALIETLYLSSPRDDAALRHPAIIAAAAQGYADGIRAFFHGRTKVTVTS